MKILFISRKKHSDIGGLSRFSYELINRFPDEKVVVTPETPLNLLKSLTAKVDLIHLTDATLFPLGVLVKSIIHRPLTVTAHGLDLSYPNPFYQSMLKLFSPKAHAFILDSNPVKKLLKNLLIQIKRTYIINPGITVDQLKKSEKFDLPNQPNKINLLTVGNLVKRKGVCWFITNVMTKLEAKFNYFIVGDGIEMKNLKSQISNLNLKKRVFLLGRLTNKQLAYLYKKSHIYVCPNIKDANNFEGFGIATGEAAAMGLPVVASQVDGIPEVIKNGKNGLLVPPDPSSFITAISKLSSLHLRSVIGTAAKTYTLTNFNWNKTVQNYIRVFQEVIDKTPKSH